MVDLVNSEIYYLGCARNVENTLHRLTINLRVKFALNVELIQAKKNSIKDNIFVLSVAIQPLATMRVRE